MLLKAIAVSVVVLLSSAAFAQDSGPAIVPERIQELAASLPIAERMGFKWEAATQEDVGLYIGVLAAANEVAKGIAFSNDRKTPTDADYQAALAAFCMWPNKPPIVEQYWASSVAAFGNHAVRSAFQTAVGSLAISLPGAIDSGDVLATISDTWPEDESRYFDEVLDFEAIFNVR